MKKVTFDISLCVPIIDDGAIANKDTGEGRLIPVVILDFSNHNEFLNMLHSQEDMPPGDVTTSWAFQKLNRRFAYLNLAFTKPSEIQIVLEFDLMHRFALADGIVQSRGVYLQPSTSGEKVSEGIGSSKILIEVPVSTVYPHWDNILRLNMRKTLRKKGFSKKNAKKAAVEHLLRIREMWSHRM